MLSESPPRGVTLPILSKPRSPCEGHHSKLAQGCAGNLPEAEASGSTIKLSPTRHGAAVTADRLDERVRLLDGAELANCKIKAGKVSKPP